MKENGLEFDKEFFKSELIGSNDRFHLFHKIILIYRIILGGKKKRETIFTSKVKEGKNITFQEGNKRCYCIWRCLT